MRPLSFLSQIETCIRRENSTALPETTMRAIDFRQGLARLQLTSNGDTIVVQCYVLADGRDCLKAIIHWADSEETEEVAVYPNEVNRGTIWDRSAEKVATLWLQGAPDAQHSDSAESDEALAAAAHEHEPMQAAG